MKRIFLLSFLLVGLGVFTYQFEELGGIKKRAEIEKKEKIIDESFLGEMLEVSGPNFLLKKEGDRYVTSTGRKVDLARFQKYLDVLGKMKVRRNLSEDENLAVKFPEDSPVLKFKFKNGEMKFKLGEKLQFDQSFYMAITQHGKTKNLIAYDSSPTEGTYDKESFHRNPEKYLRFKTMILLNEEFFVDTHLFQKEYEIARRGKSIDWETLEIDNLRNRSFKINLQNRTTTPLPPQSLGNKSEAFQLFLNDLVGFSGNKWLSPGQLEDEVASLVIKKNDGSKQTIKVYKKYNTQSGNFAHIVEENKTLSFNAKAMQVFFKNAQDFWNLSPISEKEPEKLSLDFPEDKKVDVKFEHGRMFKALSLDKMAGEAINTAFRSLLDVLSTEANHLTAYEKGDKLGASSFKISLGGEGRDFHVILGKEELILANKDSGYKLHYRLDSLPKFGTKLKDFFLK